MSESTLSGKKTRPGPGRLAAAGTYAVCVVALWMGAAIVASFSGELPVYEPTPDETTRWSIGLSLLYAGFGLLLLWGVIFVSLRKRLSLTFGPAVLTAVIAIALGGTGAAIAWSIALPTV